MRDPNRRIPFYGLLEDELSINELGTELPELPKNMLEWIAEARPLVMGRPRNFDLFPFYIRRFIVHPVFLLILLPAFYYHKRATRK